jgi:hypothetical protein
MPVNLDYGIGQNTTAGASAAFREFISVDAGATVNTDHLRTQGMNILRIYGYHQTANAGVTLQPQFAIDMTDGIPNPQLRWFDFPSAVIITANAPREITFNFAAKFIRVAVSGDAAINVTTLQVILSCSQGGGGN